LCTGSIQNIERLKVRRGFRYIVESIFNRHLLAELIDDADAVFHLAASVGVAADRPRVRCGRSRTTSKGTETVLEFAGKKKKKVLITSTSEVYGKSTKIPFCEDDDLSWAARKKGAGAMPAPKPSTSFSRSLTGRKEFAVVIVRLFNTVGPRQTGRYGMVPAQLRARGARGRTADGFRRWQAVALLLPRQRHRGRLAKLIEHPEAVGEIFNVGSEEEILHRRARHLVKSMTRSASPIQYIPYDQAYEAGFEDMQRRVPDTSKVKNLVGFRTTHDTRQVVQSVIDYFSPAAKTAAHKQEVAGDARGEGFLGRHTYVRTFKTFKPFQPSPLSSRVAGSMKEGLNCLNVLNDLNSPATRWR